MTTYISLSRHRCCSNFFFFFFLMIRRPPRSTLSSSSAASDVYKRQYTGCVGQAARSIPYVFDPKNLQNRTSFGDFLKLLIRTLPPTGCSFTMTTLYRDLMLDRMDGTPVHDAVVRTDDFFGTVRSALQAFECHVPHAVNWEVLGKMEQQSRAFNFNRDRLRVPYHCFYDETSRELVEEHDRLVLERYNYSFDNFVERGEHLGDCNSIQV
eukprot:TRINITY_DN38015_c0_g1_i2.p1 TRINITY_DN38015_c0_g1~~TRINITY_DN38015_c0_g1_i2.p1  ORF type:complete len:210 (+),score=52.37 TRINITY_DN38015_c0_g1_i2:44-673(+)